jgi:hypothetical protein
MGAQFAEEDTGYEHGKYRYEYFLTYLLFTRVRASLWRNISAKLRVGRAIASTTGFITCML